MKKFSLISIYAFIGGSLRESISLLFPNNLHFFAIMLINILGCSLMALLIKFFETNDYISLLNFEALKIGLIGSFTTFSTFSKQTFILLQQQQFFLAFLYVFFSFAISIVIVFFILNSKDFYKNVN